MYIPHQNAPKSYTTKTQRKNNRTMQLEPPCPESTFVMMCFNHKLNGRCTKPNQSDSMDDFRRQAVYAADTPKHGHTHRGLFPRIPLRSHYTAKHTNPTKRSEAYCWHKLLTLLSHFLTSLTTAVLSSLAPYHRSDLCGGNWTGFVSPTVVTCPKIPPPSVAAGWLLASNSYELLRAFMLQMQ